MVRGGDSCIKGREFESWHYVLEKDFFTYPFVQNLVCVFEKTKINEKETGDWPIFIKNIKPIFTIFFTF